MHEILPESYQQLMIVESRQEVLGYQIKQPNHLGKVLLVFIFFDFLLTHHFDLECYSQIHFLWLADFFFDDLSIKKVSLPLLHLCLGLGS